MIKVGNDGCKGTASEGKTNYPDDFYYGAKYSFEIVCATYVAISDGRDCSCCPIKRQHVHVDIFVVIGLEPSTFVILPFLEGCYHDPKARQNVSHHYDREADKA